MYARVTRFEGRPPDTIDDGIRNAREFIVPAFREFHGWRGIVALVDRATGDWIALTLWSSKETLDASEQLAHRLRQQALVPGERMASVERYEVAVLEIDPAAAAAFSVPAVEEER